MAFELIEASAGTGKTYALTSRYILLLVDAGLQVDQILVVTFTEAATAELRDRIRSRIRDVRNALTSDTLDTLEDKALQDLLRNAGSTSDKRKQAEKRLTTALVAFDEAAIFTIHGFCRRVLSEKAFSSGMDFAAEVLTNDLSILESVVADFARSRLNTLSAEEYASCVEHGVFFDGASSADWRSSGPMMTPDRLKTLRDIVSNPFIRLVPPPAPRSHVGQAEPPRETAFAVMHELIAYVREAFARRKQELGVISFNDMLSHVRTALAGDGGTRLALELRSTFRAALIDEFQDTDPLQYDIIRRIYEGSECPVVFVGDPKQAIYSFRGGDIFAYFHATRQIPGERKTTLPINYRSAKDLVTAVSNIFTFGGQTFPFADGDKTAFPQVSAQHPSGKDPLRLPDSRNRAAFHWFVLPDPVQQSGKSKGTFGWSKPEAEQMALDIMVQEIRSLVPRPEHKQGELTHGDIAVLVRTNQQAVTVQENLRSAGIPCIVRTLGSVFASDAAADLLALLRAVASPGNEAALSTALISPSMGYTAADVSAMKNDAGQYGEVADRFLALRSMWEHTRNGFIHMATELLHAPGLAAGGLSIAEHLLGFIDAERRLTDMLHLVELLHQESVLHPGHEHLLRWMEEQRGDRAEQSEEASIRLESDAKRVQIVTVHSSKGLEYPVVFCPYTWEGNEVKRKSGSVVFCHEQGELAGGDERGLPSMIADLGSPDYENHFQISVREKQSESLRLLYVALTRARQRCYAIWGQANKMEHAALAWLFFPGCGGSSANIKKLSYDRIIEPLHSLMKNSGGAVSVSTIEKVPVEPARPVQLVGGTATTLSPPRSYGRGSMPPSWAFASYTSLTSDWIRSGRDTDTVSEGVPAKPADSWSIFSFPAGARTGTLWHRLFEDLDFHAPREDHERLVKRLLKVNGYPEAFIPALTNMVATALRVPLGPASLRLETLGNESCVKELDFMYRIDHLRISRFREVIQQPQSGLAPAFAAAAAKLRDRDIRGFMIGTIDLLAEHQGKFYLLDYKSNHLGDSNEAYAGAALTDVMAREHYYLQQLIYTIAVHRYLHLRVRGYSYETHFGGVIYLFLRGLSDRRANGIYFDRPEPGLVTDLDTCLRENGKP